MKHAALTLGQLELPSLRALTEVQIDNLDESNPEDCGPLNVRLTFQGIEIAWSGAAETDWKVSWTDLRHIIQVFGQREARDEELRWIEAEREELQLARRNIETERAARRLWKRQTTAQLRDRRERRSMLTTTEPLAT